MKCTKELFSKEGLKSNISSYILLIIIFFFLSSITLFIKSGYHLLDEEIRLIINLIEKFEKNKNNVDKNNMINTQNKKRRPIKLNANYPPKKNYNLNLINNIKMNKEKNTNSILYQRNKPKSIGTRRTIMKKGKTKIKKKKGKKFNSINKENLINNKKVIKLEFNIFELNTFNYGEVIIHDKRTYCEYYISLLKIKHSLIFSFCPIKDYIILIIIN